MADQWISAATARALVIGPSKNSYGVAEAICTRAHHGLLAARCALFTVADKRRDNADVPPEFWWAKGEAALDQNWTVGDFATWIDRKVECRAFGVTFSLDGLLAMIPSERRGAARRAVSAHGSADWVSSSEALQLVKERTGLSEDPAASAIIQQATFGFLPARATMMIALAESVNDGAESQKEWDVPDKFWASLYPDSNWVLGTFGSQTMLKGSLRTLSAMGVHFALSALDIAFPPKSNAGTSSSTVPPVEPSSTKIGRPPAAFWDELWCAVWGDIYRGDLKPRTQADVQTAMLDWLQAHGHNDNESTVKPRARLLFQEINREGKKSAPG